MDKPPDRRRCAEARRDGRRADAPCGAWSVFRSSDRRLFAQVPVGDRCEIYALKSTTFRVLLINCYFVDRHKLPTDAELWGVLGALEAFARFDGGTPPISSASATIKAQNRCIT